MTDPTDGLPPEERDVLRILRGAGQRDRPPADVEREVRENLRAEWREVVSAGRERKRRQAGLALAAGVAVAAVGAWLIAPRMQAPQPVLANVVLAHGELRVADGVLGRWRDVADGEAIHQGQRLMTGPDDRGALLLPSGLSLRMDHGTQVVMLGAGLVDLQGGAVYVDAGADARPTGDFTVQTKAGTVRHLGTQYQVRLDDLAVHVMIREGRVLLSRVGAADAEGRAGEQMTIRPSGAISRAPIEPHDASWDWVIAAAPVISIDGESMAGFLSWAGRELGRTIIYDSAAAEADARSTILSGSVAGLTPDQALEAVLATTLLHADIMDGVIRISLGATAGG